LSHSLLENIIAEHGSMPTQNYRRRIAMTVRRVSRIIALPALVAMVGGLSAYWLTATTHPSGISTSLPGPATVPFSELTRPSTLLSALGAMSFGLLALALLPATTVLLILIDHLRGRRWVDVVVAAGVLGILILSAFVAHR